MDILQNIDVGLVVMDQKYNVVMWNSFMQNHSGKTPEDVLQRSIFTVFPELSEGWFLYLKYELNELRSYYCFVTNQLCCNVGQVA
ncbi:MAG: PAS domain-containing protein [Moraxellaceae bacterium]|nr:MAG: PAS domain-containing protein [Moraxellaceae bacterium]